MIRKFFVLLLFIVIISSNAFAFDKDSFTDAYSGIEFKKLNYKTYLAVYEVTQEQWYKVMGTAPFTFNNGGKYPAETISIGDIQKFLDKLNQQTKSSYRLPTVAEWKEAAGDPRVNRDEVCGYANLYDISSNRVNRYGNIYFECDDKYPNTAPVGSFAPNEKGFYDLFGNVKEWCCNSESDRTNSCANLLGAASLAVVGGSFGDGPKEMKNVIKDERTSLRYAGLGFRLAIDKSAINDEAVLDPNSKVIAPVNTTPIESVPADDNKSTLDNVTVDSSSTNAPAKVDDNSSTLKNYESSVTGGSSTQNNTAPKNNTNSNSAYENNSSTRSAPPKEEERKFKFLPFLRD